MATDVDGVYTDWGTPSSARIDQVTPGELRAMTFPAGSMGPKVDGGDEFVEPTGQRVAIGSLEDIDEIVDGRQAPTWSRRRRDDRHASVCTQRWASCARSSSIDPSSALKRLTPANHDELLFDDVLWVERAQWEHDQFVARMRERGVEVFLLQDLLGETLAAERRGPAPADRAGRVGVHGRARASSTRSRRCLDEPGTR